MIAFLSSGTVHLTDSITLQSDVARLHHTCVQMFVSQRPAKGPMGIRKAAFMLNEYMFDAAKSTVHRECLCFCCSLSSVKRKSTQTNHTVAAYLGSLHCHHQYSSVTNPCLGFKVFFCMFCCFAKLDHIKKGYGYIVNNISDLQNHISDNDISTVQVISCTLTLIQDIGLETDEVQLGKKVDKPVTAVQDCVSSFVIVKSLDIGHLRRISGYLWREDRTSPAVQQVFHVKPWCFPKCFLNVPA